MKKNGLVDIDFERINLLYQSAPIAVNGLLVGFSTLFFAVRELLPTNYLVFWGGAFSIALIWRIGLIIAFRWQIAADKINPQNIQKWEYFWVAMTVFTATVFSVLVFFPFSHDALIALLFIAMVFMGMSSGSAISSNSSVMVVLAFLTPTSCSLVFKTIYDAQPYYFLIAFVYTFFYLVLVFLTLNGNRVVVDNIKLRQHSEYQSIIDILTSLINRRGLKLFIDKLIPQAQRSRMPFSIVILDIDFFKRFNDTHGHLKGDQVLVQVAACLEKVAREEDLVTRFGGEEFLIVLPDANLEMAAKVVERIMIAVRNDTEVTISSGLAMFTPDISFEQLVKNADDALYLAKKQGRDRFVIADNIYADKACLIN